MNNQRVERFLIGILSSSILVIVIIACHKKQVNFDFIDPYEAESLAGNCTSNDVTQYAFTYQVNGLSSDESLTFYVGNSFFNQNWVEAPSSTTARDGLGPLFNAKSCAGCHFRDGRGLPIINEGLLFRLGTPNASDVSGSIVDLIYGGQLQDNGISSVEREGFMDIQYTELLGNYPDGTTYSLRVPSYQIANYNYGFLNQGTLISPRIAQQMVGLGLLELIPSERLLALADPNDRDGNGVTGKVNYVSNVLTGGLGIGRFGWKSNVPSIDQQVAGAFNGDIGITSSLFPNQNHTANQLSCEGLPNGGSPEITDANLAAVILYSRTLAVPIQRNKQDESVKRGKELFFRINCTDCHTPRHITGNGGAINALKNQAIHPYTDLLLHDMGEGLADNLPSYLASGNEWRTPPLWGLGLVKTVNNHTYLLHDGRARNFEEAILWHGGEGEASKNKFKVLSAKSRKELISFLESL